MWVSRNGRQISHSGRDSVHFEPVVGHRRLRSRAWMVQRLFLQTVQWLVSLLNETASRSLVRLMVRAFKIVNITAYSA